jgi:hypothetical protein
MYVNFYRILDLRKCVPSGSHIHWHTHTHTRRFVFQCHWNIYCRWCISLAECGMLWAKVSIFCIHKLKKQQVCNGDRAHYLDWRNSHHTLVKWYFFLYWGTSASGIWITLTTRSVQTIRGKYFRIIIPRSRTNVQLNLLIAWCHPAAGQCPSPCGLQISELNTV